MLHDGQPSNQHMLFLAVTVFKCALPKGFAKVSMILGDRNCGHHHGEQSPLVERLLTKADKCSIVKVNAACVVQ